MKRDQKPPPAAGACAGAAAAAGAGAALGAEVEGSRVILRGTVRSYAEKQAAEDTAWSAPGVTEVDSHIVVSPML